MTVLSIAAAVTASACDPFPESYSYRYRLTVEVDTPQGLKTGSSVIENTETRGSGIPDESIHGRRRGEAVAVDLAGGKTVFALLKTETGGEPNFADTAYDPVLPRRGGMPEWAARNRAIAEQTKVATLPQGKRPMFVWFRDIRNPATIQIAKPEDFAEAFGSGISLRRVSVQITDGPITRGISKRFPWWRQYFNKNFDGSSSSIRYANQKSPMSTINSGSFSTESGHE